MKLTKTQTLLVQEAAANPFRRMVAESYCGTGADGGRVRGGDRRANAARGLVKDGLAERISCDQSRLYRNGNCVHVYSSLYKVKPEGFKLAGVSIQLSEK